MELNVQPDHVHLIVHGAAKGVGVRVHGRNQGPNSDPSIQAVSLPAATKPYWGGAIILGRKATASIR